MLSLRLLLHAIACGIAFVIALLSLFFGFRDKKSPFPLLALLCLSFAAYACYPLVHMLQLRGGLWYDVERMGYYAFLFATIWLAGRMAGTKPAVYRTAMALAAVVCLSVPLYRQLVSGGSAIMLYRYSTLLACWKWAVALYLLGSVGYAVFRKHVPVKALLAGIVIIAAALVADRLFPLYEPIASGWFGEIAAFVLVLIIMGVLCADALNTYKESRAFAARAQLDALRLSSFQQQEQLQAAYIEQTRKLLHDTRGSYLTLRHYSSQSDWGALAAHIDAQLGELSGLTPAQITPHRLLNTILTEFLARAGAASIRVTYTVEVPGTLHITDQDLSRLVINILDNALEACLLVEDATKAWVAFEAYFAAGVLEITCENTYTGAIQKTGNLFKTHKKDAASHGYGTRIITEITERLGSRATFTWDANTFRVVARLHIGL